MALLLLVILLVGYIILGIAAKNYNWFTRAILLIMTFGVPAGFYFMF